MGNLVRSKRIEWMTDNARKRATKSKGATHGTDTPIWFRGNGESLNAEEKQVTRDSWETCSPNFCVGSL